MSGSAGFTLLEVAIVLTVAGLIAAAAAAVYLPVTGAAQGQRTVRLLAGIQQAIVGFAVSHRRLPCADTNGNGFEGGGMPAGCVASATDSYQTGRVPYKTLGIVMSGASGDDAVYANVVYGVYRNSNVIPNADADLAVAEERTGDASDNLPGYDALGDFRKALANAAGTTASSNYIHVTKAGDTNCTVIRNMAFALVSTGIGDADNDGNPFDGVNKNLKLSGGGSKCFASPAQRHDGRYDDQVVAVGFNALAAGLTADMNE